MSLAAGRERRANAGAKMAKLINEEEEEADDFYKTAYGGFEELEQDNEFVFKEEDVEEDVVDSDFDMDENEENEENNNHNNDEDEESRRNRRVRRGGGVVTKAYKEPSKKATSSDGVAGKKIKVEAASFINKEFVQPLTGKLK